MFNLNKLKAVADELGFKITVNSPNPGFHFISPNNIVQSFSYDEIEQILSQKFNQNYTKNQFKIDYNIATPRKITYEMNSEILNLESTIIPNIKIQVGDFIKDVKTEKNNFIQEHLNKYNVYKNDKAA